MRSPAGLQAAGKRLWKSVTEEFDLETEPHKLHILAQAARVADVIAELDDAADQAPRPSGARWGSRSSRRSSPKRGLSAR
jgi:hypothetical protein